MSELAAGDVVVLKSGGPEGYVSRASHPITVFDVPTFREKL